MEIDIAKLRGSRVYLEFLSPSHREAIRTLAKNEVIWEFNKMLPGDDSYDAAYDSYFDAALDKNGLGGQQTFVIKQTDDNSIIGMTRFYEISPKEKTVLIGYTWYIPAVWGKVYNKECKLLLLEYAFENMTYSYLQ